MKRIALTGLALTALLLTACGGSSNVVETTEARAQGRAYERIAHNLSNRPDVTRCSMVKAWAGFFDRTITHTISCEGDALWLEEHEQSLTQ